MEFARLKEAFYKRYGEGSHFLHYTSCGALCTLLGHSDMPSAPFLACGLSMRVEMFARKTDGSVIKLESTESNKCMQYRRGEKPKLYKGKTKRFAELLNSVEKIGINGAEILYKSTIPEFVSADEAFSAALIKTLMTVSGRELDAFKIAEICTLNNNPIPYAAVLSAKKGYSVYADKGDIITKPFPLLGYKILTIHCNEKIISYADKLNDAMEIIHQHYPHIKYVTDVKSEMVENTLGALKYKEYIGLMYHLLNENDCITEAQKALTRCDIKAFFWEVNKSQKSLERFSLVGEEHNFIVQTLKILQGVSAARCNNNGVYAVVEEECLDNVVNTVKSEFERIMGYSPSFCISDTM